MQRNERSTGQIETQPPSNTLTPLVLESTNTSRMRRERGLDTNSKTRLHPDCTTTMLGSELSGVRRRSPAYTGCCTLACSAVDGAMPECVSEMLETTTTTSLESCTKMPIEQRLANIDEEQCRGRG